MRTRFATLLRRVCTINFPTLSLLALLQRTPAVQVAASAGELVFASPIGAVLKSAAAIAATLGAMNSLAGATPLVPSTGSSSGMIVTAGTSVSIFYTVNGTQTPPQSWTINGPIPPGLNFSGRTTPGTVNVQNLHLSGTPTAAGTYDLTITAWEFTNSGGIGSPDYAYRITVMPGAATAPAISTQPQNQSVSAGGNGTLTAAASGSPAPTWVWKRNGADVAGATNATLQLNNAQPAGTGLYLAVATNSAGSAQTNPAIFGVTTTSRVIGAGTVVGTDIVHPNGNHFDQVLVNGAAEAVTAEFGVNRITRTSFIDLDGDIVQVEFGGPGTLSLVLDTPTGPALPQKYSQAVNYMKGHAGIVIVGANENTNVSVFTVGRATAFDPTGGYNILVAPGGANNPANNGSSLFVGHGGEIYDGIADIAFIAIASTNGRFGGVRAANANLFAANGLTGLYAPGVQFTGPVYLGNITAFDNATPVLQIGSATNNTWITGGDLAQANGRHVLVSGLTQLAFKPGSDSAGNQIAAKANQAVLEQNGADVTSQIVANP